VVHDQPDPLDSEWVTHAIDAVAPQVTPSALRTLRRNAAIVGELRGETATQSLERLTQGELFRVSPSFAEYPPSLPVRAEVESLVVQSVFGNRRFAKVLGDLGDAGAGGPRMLADCMEGAINRYSAKLDATLASALAHNRSYKARTGKGLTFGCNEIRMDMSQPPTLGEMRWQLFSLLLAAGNLSYEGAHPVVRRLLVIARSQRELFTHMEELDDAQRYVLVSGWSLYNRMVLATAIVGTAPQTGDRPGAFPPDLQRREVRLSPFDALATPSEAEMNPGLEQYVDARVPGVCGWYLEVSSDEQFVALLRAYGLSPDGR
jgi:hypothetical protein